MAKRERTNKTQENGKVRLSAKNLPELSVVLTYLVQALGEATQPEVEAKLEALKCTVDTRTVTRVLEALRAKRIVSEGHRGSDRIYRMAQLRWNCNVEVAHVTNITTLIQELEQAEPGNYEAIVGRMTTDKGGKIKQPPPKDYTLMRATIRLRDVWLAGHPFDGSDDDMKSYQASPTAIERPDPKEPFLVFHRGDNGEVLINRACILGFFKNHLRRAGKPEYLAEVFGCEHIEFTPTNGEVGLKKLPIQRAGVKFTNEGTGAGMSWYETLKKGTELAFDFVAPLENFMTFDELKKWLGLALRYPHRSISPGRGKQFGSAELLSLEKL